MKSWKKQLRHKLLQVRINYLKCSEQSHWELSYGELKVNCHSILIARIVSLLHVQPVYFINMSPWLLTWKERECVHITPCFYGLTAHLISHHLSNHGPRWDAYKIALQFTKVLQWNFHRMSLQQCDFVNVFCECSILFHVGKLWWRKLKIHTNQMEWQFNSWSLHLSLQGEISTSVQYEPKAYSRIGRHCKSCSQRWVYGNGPLSQGVVLMANDRTS